VNIPGKPVFGNDEFEFILKLPKKARGKGRGRIGGKKNRASPPRDPEIAPCGNFFVTGMPFFVTLFAIYFEYLFVFSTT